MDHPLAVPATETGVIFYHNWLYSVVPVASRVEDWDNNKSTVHYPLKAYLTGYCRNCNNAFSVLIPSDPYAIKVTRMGVPKDGCVGPQ